MDTTIFFIILLSGLVILGVLIYRKLTQLGQGQKPNDELLEVIKVIQEGSKEDRKALLGSLQENTRAVNQRLDQAAKVISDVQKNIGEFSEIGRGMKDLQEFLRSPKLRGNIGEQVLTEVLSQMLPKQNFALQYTFKSGEKVDAIVKTTGGLVPIDSKFPLSAFRKLNKSQTEKEKEEIGKEFEKDVAKHIKTISNKYILTNEGTVDYALMFVPSEAVYYEVVNRPALFDLASKLRVLPVSSTTFYAYLRAILMSFEGQKIEKEARAILASLRAIQKDYAKVEDNLGTLQSHLNNAFNKMTDVFTTFTKLGQQISSTQSLGEVAEEDNQGSQLT